MCSCKVSRSGTGAIIAYEVVQLTMQVVRAAALAALSNVKKSRYICLVVSNILFHVTRCYYYNTYDDNCVNTIRVIPKCDHTETQHHLNFVHNVIVLQPRIPCLQPPQDAHKKR